MGLAHLDEAERAALGVLGAFVYVALRSWLPARGRYRSLFVFLNTTVSLASFAAVLLLYGVAVPPLIDRLAPRTAGRSRWGYGVVGCVLTLSLVVGALAVKHAFEYAEGSRLPG